MKYTIQLTSTTLLSLSLLLSSCAELANTLENTGAMAAIGGGAGEVLAPYIGHGNSRQKAMIGGLIGSVVGVAISEGYKANQKQCSYAQAQANHALTRNRSVMNSVKDTGAKYVAVPVKADPHNPDSKPAVLRVPVERCKDGTLKAGEADPKQYPVETAKTGTDQKAKSGTELNVGGKAAVFYDI